MWGRAKVRCSPGHSSFGVSRGGPLPLAATAMPQSERVGTGVGGGKLPKDRAAVCEGAAGTAPWTQKQSTCLGTCPADWHCLPTVCPPHNAPQRSWPGGGVLPPPPPHVVPRDLRAVCRPPPRHREQRDARTLQPHHGMRGRSRCCPGEGACRGL